MATKFSYHKYFYYEPHILDIYAGVNPISDTFIMYHIVWVIFNILIPVPMVILQATTFIVDMETLEKLLYDCQCAPGLLYGGFAIYYTIQNIGRIQEIFAIMFTDSVFMPRDGEEQTMIKDAFKICKIVRYTFPIGTGLIIVGASLADIEISHYLPFVCWYPVDVTKSPIFEIVFIHQALSAYYIAFIVAIYEVLIIGFTSFIALQCKFICHRLEILKTDEKSLSDIIELHTKVIRWVC